VALHKSYGFSSGSDLTVKLRVAYRVEQLAIGGSSRNIEGFQVLARDERRRVELGRRQIQLGSTEVNRASVTVERYGDGFAIAKQLVNARGD
jgi:hypothetical protein